MKPLRKYHKATIYFRDCNEPNGEYFDVCVYSSVLIFFDAKGHEKTIPMVFVKEVIEYVEDRVQPVEQSVVTQNNLLTPEQLASLTAIAERPIVRKIQSPKSGKAYHV